MTIAGVPVLDVLCDAAAIPTTVLTHVKEAHWERGRSATFQGDAQGTATILLNNVTGQYTATPIRAGMHIIIKSTWAATTRAHFFGIVQNVKKTAKTREIELTCYDMLKVFSDSSVIVPASTVIQRNARQVRIDALADFERGNLNLFSNPSFETDTGNWSVTAPATLTRLAGSAAPPVGTAYARFAATAAGQSASTIARLAPVFFTGEEYRLSAYVRVPSGTGSIKFVVSAFDGHDQERTFPLTTTWKRFDLSYLMQTTGTGSTGVMGMFVSTGSGNVDIDNVAFTRGKGLHAYEHVGTGRWPSWVGNGGFEAGGGSLSGWIDGFHNYVTNPSFETNTTGWTGVTRLTTAPYVGAGHGSIVSGTPGVYALTGITFKAGRLYTLTFVARATAGLAGFNAPSYLGSAGTAGDRSGAISATVGTSYTTVSVTWTPSADRTDAEIRLTSPNTIYIDAVMVTAIDPGLTPVYTQTGPGSGIGSYVNASYLMVGSATRGYVSHGYDTAAVIGSGRMYDFNQLGSYFVSGRTYSFSIVIRPSSTMPYRIGIGALKPDGTWDEASVTGSAPPSAWTRVTGTWTPTANYSSFVNLSAVGFVFQTDATARTILIDEFRVIPSSSVDDWEMPHWLIPQFTGEAQLPLQADVSFSGSLASTLSALNEVSLSHHWIRPKLTSPGYDYMVAGYDDIIGKSLAEDFDKAYSGFENADEDRDSVINEVTVSWQDGTQTFVDQVSIDTYGERPKSIDGSSLLLDQGQATAIGERAVALFKDMRIRPKITRRNKFPSMLQRDLDDLVQLTNDELDIVDEQYTIQYMAFSVTKSMTVWDVTYTLEAYPY